MLISSARADWLEVERHEEPELARRMKRPTLSYDCGQSSLWVDAGFILIIEDICRANNADETSGLCPFF